MALVYMATCVATGMSYVGLTTLTLAERRQAHEGAARRGLEGCRKFWRALRKYGTAGFAWRVLEDDLTLEEAKAAEIRLIALHGTQARGLNLAAGGEGGTSHPESRSRAAAKLRGRKLKPEHIKSTRKSLLARHGKTPEGVRAAVERVAAGAYLRDVAEDLGWSVQSLWKACREAGVQAPHGRKDRKRHPRTAARPRVKAPPKPRRPRAAVTPEQKELRSRRRYAELLALGFVVVPYEVWVAIA